MIVMVLVVTAFESAQSMLHVPWLLLTVVVLLFWHRWGRGPHAGSHQ